MILSYNRSFLKYICLKESTIFFNRKLTERTKYEGINNATNSVTVVAVLFATVAFAAIFTVPGGFEGDNN